MLPDLEGHGVLRQLRDARVPTPVLMLSGLAELDHKIRGLGLGADDYLTKPFEREELVARIHAIIRRSQGHAQSQVDVGRLSIKMAERSAEVDGTPLALTGREYSVLELLALRKGATVNKEQFLTHLYGGVDEPDLKIIDVFVCKLRRKIAKATGGDHYIATEWGRGYTLREPDAERVAS
jgi:two-component system cell cycle response regulator CtrA